MPGLFGSIPYQSLNYIGVDCADMLVATYCKLKNLIIRKNHSVSSLVEGLSKVAEFDIAKGTPDKRVSWGKLLKPGYLIAVKYNPAKGYRHIGVLAGDTNGSGYLDKDDRILQAGASPLYSFRGGLL